ncbi:xanthine dehydrogenase molybdenum-binding subunit XdhA [Enterococcus hirae]|nr:xanthine dehydrogenase molybdenum-binding subunit XdhA [Enterococcus hirae]
MHIVGKNMKRVDAVDKVTGVAEFCDDMAPEKCLVAKIVHSTIAHGKVKSFDLEEALAVPGVKKILTCFDVPDIQYSSCGHPWNLVLEKRDFPDRKLLNEHVRFYGDEVAVVIADDEVSATQAANAVKVEYEEYPVFLTPQESLKSDLLIHEEKPQNILGEHEYVVGTPVDIKPDAKEFKMSYHTQPIQHAHIENANSYAQIKNGKIVIVSSTQIPHIVRRITAQALGIDWGKVRVIKPYVGGGFGNKQDSLFEPLNAFCTVKMNGELVKLSLSREEVFYATRTRHAMDIDIDMKVDENGRLQSREVEVISNNGGYASHGHSVCANAMGFFKNMYQDEHYLRVHGRTVYTNISTAGAMRAYGIPQASFAMESMMDDVALKLGMDPIDFRLKNCITDEYVDEESGTEALTCGLPECIERGREYIHWDEKRKKYANQTGNIRRGVGMSIFLYECGIYPISLEHSSCRMVLNQDGSMQVQLGATEIGQGADTVFTQMASEITGISPDKVYIQSMQDTEVTPFDTAAYASRQTYVAGGAVKKVGLELKEKILEYAAFVLDMTVESLDIENDQIVNKFTRKVLRSVADIAEESIYSRERSIHITAEDTFDCRSNAFSMGCCFVEVEVDMALGKVKVLDAVDVHDCGRVINPGTASGQVHGGMAMSIAYALSEELLFNQKGKMLNDNLLDYKIPTSMDLPDLKAEFVETEDPTGPFGNKSLGEPPCIPAAAAIRNAVLQATGIGFDRLPLTPQRLIERFQEEKMI